MLTSPIRVGAASWADKSLTGSGLYYPPDCKTPEARLRFYASEFPLVEVDTSFYAIPEERTALQWADRTPEGFTFDMKAFRLFTGHPTDPKVLPPDLREELPSPLKLKKSLYYHDLSAPLIDALWRRFEETLAPLTTAGKLGVVVFQFPPWFLPNRENRAHIEECRARLPSLRLAVEFRSRFWLGEESAAERALAFLRQHDLCYVAVDEPQGFESSVPAVPAVTGPYGLVRFHGRNGETWEKKGLAAASDRFDYYYRKDEIREWAPRIAAMAEDSEQVHVIMNTNRADQGIANARMMAEVLGQGLWR